jgi:hypothetical protein
MRVISPLLVLTFAGLGTAAMDYAKIICNKSDAIVCHKYERSLNGYIYGMMGLSHPARRIRQPMEPSDVKESNTLVK